MQGTVLAQKWRDLELSLPACPRVSQCIDIEEDAEQFCITPMVTPTRFGGQQFQLP